MQPYTFEKMVNKDYAITPTVREPLFGERRYLVNERQPVDVISAPLIPGSDALLATAMIPATGFQVTGNTDKKNGRLGDLGFGQFPALRDMPTGLNPSLALGMRTITEFYNRNENVPPLDYLYVVSCDPSLELFDFLAHDTRFAQTELQLVRAACSGYALAQVEAWQLVQAQQRPLNIGILCAEAMTPLTLADPTVNIIFGDAAVFVVMPEFGIKSRLLGASDVDIPDDPHTPNLGMPDYGEDRTVVTPSHLITRPAPINVKAPTCITMPGGPAIYKQVMETVPRAIIHSLQQARYVFPWISPDLIVFHQSNKRMQEELLRLTIQLALGLHAESEDSIAWDEQLKQRLIIEMAHTSNLSAASVPIALLLAQSDPAYAQQLHEITKKLDAGQSISILEAVFGAGFFGEAVVLEVDGNAENISGHQQKLIV